MNDVNVNTFTVGGTKSRGTVTIAAGGTLNLSGDSNTATDLLLGDNNVNTGTQAIGIFDMTGGTFNATLDALVVGRHDEGSGQGA